MPTETQRNFRKQMQLLEEEQKNGQQKEGFYSYIERDYINNYYDKKSKRKAIYTSISVGGILVLLWNAYALYTWISPYFNANKIEPRKVLSQGLTTYGMSTNYNPIQKEIGYYLQNINEINNQLTDYHRLRQSNLDLGLRENNRKQYIETAKYHTKSVLDMYNQLQRVIPPDKMNNYHELLLSSYESSYQAFLFAENALEASESNIINHNINELNDAIRDYNIKSAQARKELLRMFDEIGIEYYEKEGLIHYSW